MAHATTYRVHTAKPAPKTLASRIWSALSLRHQRQQLHQLSDQQLADLGITRAEAEAEAKRPLWDAPSHWKR